MRIGPYHVSLLLVAAVAILIAGGVAAAFLLAGSSSSSKAAAGQRTPTAQPGTVTSIAKLPASQRPSALSTPAGHEVVLSAQAKLHSCAGGHCRLLPARQMLVVIENVAGGRLTTQTDSQGRFRLALAPGRYRLTVTAGKARVVARGQALVSAHSAVVKLQPAS